MVTRKFFFHSTLLVFPTNLSLCYLYFAYFNRWLIHLDPTNYDLQKIEGYIDICEKFVVELFDKKHLSNPDDDVEISVSGDESDINSKPSANKSPTKQQREDKMKVDIPPMKQAFYARFLNQKSIVPDESITATQSIDKESAERKRADIRAGIHRNVLAYTAECRTASFARLSLEKFGNKLYEKEKDSIDIHRIMPPYKDGHYIYKYFDVTRWWSEDGCRKFPYLALAASIVLGKPSHNGFQERVFSRGTYFDSALKQRMKEENFEKSVLNSLTQTKVAELLVTMHEETTDCTYDVGKASIKNFFSKERNPVPIYDTSEDVVVVEEDAGKTKDNVEDDDSAVVSVEDDNTSTIVDGVIRNPTTAGVLTVPNNTWESSDDDLSILTVLEKEDDLGTDIHHSSAMSSENVESALGSIINENDFL